MAQSLTRICYVEDEPDIRAVARLALTALGGFELDVSASGPEALERIPQFRPDLVLLDVMMPGMDGPEVFARLKGIPGFSSTPVVFMTAKAQSHEVAHYHRLGAAGVITKPFDPMTLSDTVRAIWDGAHAPREA